MPTGEIVASDARGTLMGNRGIIHDPGGKTLLKQRWTHQAWVSCRLEFKGWHRTVMGHRTYTELFFLDEATAFAAGHRPCRTCRHARYSEFKAAWLAGNPVGHDHFVPIGTIDRRIHRERVTRRHRQVRFRASLERLPSGAMILVDSSPYLVWHDHLLAWGETGYGARLPKHRGTATVLTPKSIVAALSNNYLPEVHASAYWFEPGAPGMPSSP